MLLEISQTIELLAAIEPAHNYGSTGSPVIFAFLISETAATPIALELKTV